MALVRSSLRQRITEFESCTHYEQLLDAVHRLKARYQSRRNITIVQLDAHIWNSVLGRDSGSDIRLFGYSKRGVRHCMLDRWLKIHAACQDCASGGKQSQGLIVRSARRLSRELKYRARRKRSDLGLQAPRQS